MSQPISRLNAALRGRYRIERELGEGGMATVYVAADLSHDRQVAIKVLRPEYADAVNGERFSREIRLMRRIAHSSVLPVLDSGVAAGLPFYATPYLPEGSLRDRLLKERQLALDESYQYTLDLLEAVGAAHASGILHRDIKPENLFIEDGRIIVADFGIARALEDAGANKLTKTGVVLGTPGYMSPEQATGDGPLDARSDVYSIGCVLFELLAGEPPYTGRSSQAIIARQLSQPVPDLRVLRDSVSLPVSDVLKKALARSPADRFASCESFAEALNGAIAAGNAGEGFRSEKRSRRLAFLTGALFVIVGTWVGIDSWREREELQLRDDHYLVLPFDYSSADTNVPRLDEVRQFRDALSRWSGLTVVDPLSVQELVTDESVTDREADRIARAVGAGWYIRGEVSSSGDSLRVYASLRRTGGDAVEADAVLRVGVDQADRREPLTRLADQLLFRGHPPRSQEVGSNSFPAQWAFFAGQAALDTWDLAAAEVAFGQATSEDPQFAAAHLWLAVTRAWIAQPVSRWVVAAEQAALGAATLAPRDSATSVAILAMAREEVAGSCASWAAMTETWPNDFVAWYGSAHCQARDDIVVLDERSPSGFSFRSSEHNALQGYRRAFALRPAVLSAFSARSFEPLRRLFKTSGNERRFGRSSTATQERFVADLSWDGDTLALVPYPLSDQTARLGASPAAIERAVRRQRELFRDVTSAWVTEDPASSKAMLAFSIALHQLGERTALDSISKARVLAVEVEDERLAMVAEVWLRLSRALPSNIREVERARSIADTLLLSSSAPSDPLLMSGLAALTGRAGQAVELATHARAAAELEVPVSLRGLAEPLLVLSAMGAAPDTLALLRRRTGARIERFVDGPDREIAAMRWLARPATLAFSSASLETASSLIGLDPLLDAQVSWLEGDTAAARASLEDFGRARSDLRPGTITLDALYPEAELWVFLGYPERATEWIDPTLDALAESAPHILGSPVRAASLVRALALRARLAQELGDTEGARTWAQAFVALWIDADDNLQSLVTEMAEIASGQFPPP